MNKRNKYSRIRKLAAVSEHNRKYDLQQAVGNTPAEPSQDVSDGGGVIKILPPALPKKPETPTLGQLFSFSK